MIKKLTSAPFMRFATLAAAFVVVGVTAADTEAQRDPFEKPAWARTREPRVGGTGGPGGKVGETPNFGAPAIDQRIEYYKRLREDAVANSQPMPKVTSVLTLDELAVTGIFKT